jgi:hypothetical protein
MFLVGLPGLLLAVIIFLLREPKRGQMDGGYTLQQEEHPFKLFGSELAAVIPPFTIVGLMRLGGHRLVAQNLFYGSILLLMVLFFSKWLGSPVQWITIALGLYSFISWLQRLNLIDYPCYAMIFKAKAMRYSVLGYSLLGLMVYGIGFWFSPYIIRRFHATPGDVGEIMGLIVFGAGMLSIVMGGLLSDILKKRTPMARPLVGILSILAVPFYILGMMSSDLTMVYIYATAGIFLGMIWIPSSLALASELIPTRMRATGIAFNQLAGTLLGLALGPYLMGELSDRFMDMGYMDADSLQLGVVITLVVVSPMAVGLLYKSTTYIASEEATVHERAVAAGENFKP